MVIVLQEKFKNPEEFDELLNQYEKNVFYVECMVREVENGGFLQFFLNDTGDDTYETLNALKEINANKINEILDKAIQCFPQLPVSKEPEDRREIIAKLTEKDYEEWDILSDQFYNYTEDLAVLSIEYVKKNKNRFLS
jgi:hypothetical protein